MEPLEGRLLMSYSQTAPTMTLAEPGGGAANDHFGRSVLTVGGDLVVAAPFHAQGTRTSAGAVYRYSAGGTLNTTYTKAATVNGEELGWGLGAGGGQLVMGAPGAYNNAGGGYLATGNTLLNLASPNPGSAYDYGVSMATNGTQILVGANTDGTLGGSAGAAYLFDMQGNLLCKYYAPTAVSNGRFGMSVGFLANGNLVIGERGDTVNGVQQAGAVYVMSGAATGTCRTALFRLVEPAPVSGDAFGYSVATSGNQVAVGASLETVNKIQSGGAFVFDGSTGAMVRALTDPNGTAGEQFGNSVAFSSDGRVLVGAMNKGIGAAANAGEAFMFDAGTGVLTHTFTEKTTAANDTFGWSVAFSGTNQVLIGSPGTTANGYAGQGVAYLYQIADAAPVASAGPNQSANDNQTVTLNGTATDADGANDIVSYAWDLTGSGVFATSGATVSFTEAAPGTYPVSLKVTDRAGATSISTAKVTFSDVAPVVKAGPDQTAGAGSTVTLNGSATGPSGSTISSYAWDYNYNGTTFNASGAGSSATTSYATPGTYTVALRATDQYGASSISTVTVTVNDVPPTLSFTGPAAGAVGSAVGFSATVGGPTDTGQDTIGWSFGDGGSQAAQLLGTDGALNPTHVFNTAGTYTVTVTVTDPFGGVATATQTIVIS